MKKIRKLNIVLVMILLIASLSVYSYSNEIKVKLAVGKVKVYDTKTKKLSNINTGDVINKNSIIITGNNAKVIIQFNNKELKISSGITVQLNKIISKKGEFSLNQYNKIADKQSLQKSNINRLNRKISIVIGTRGTDADNKEKDSEYDNWRRPGDNSDANAINEKIREIWDLYYENELDKVLDEIDLIKNEKELCPELHLIKGLTLFKICQYKDSNDSFVKARTKKAEKYIKKTALLHIAITDNYIGNYKNSLKNLEKFSKFYGKDEDMPLCIYFKALNYIELNNIDEAKKNLKIINEKYSNSDLHESAMELLKKISK